ncbi:MAG: hypothetical protein RL210_1280, partial [Pseudomonadota bacterium]
MRLPVCRIPENTTGIQPRRLSRFSLYLATAYTLLVVYASLHPFAGWRSSGVDIFDYLWAVWPRYWTAFDLVTNVLAYLPLGLLWVPTFQGCFSRRYAV